MKRILKEAGALHLGSKSGFKLKSENWKDMNGPEKEMDVGFELEPRLGKGTNMNILFDKNLKTHHYLYDLRTTTIQ